MKVVLWCFTVMYASGPALLVWMAWTNRLTSRTELEVGTKLLLTVVLFAVSFAANYFAWSNFLRWRKRWEEK